MDKNILVNEICPNCGCQIRDPFQGNIRIHNELECLYPKEYKLLSEYSKWLQKEGIEPYGSHIVDAFISRYFSSDVQKSNTLPAASSNSSDFLNPSK